MLSTSDNLQVVIETLWKLQRGHVNSAEPPTIAANITVIRKGADHISCLIGSDTVCNSIRSEVQKHATHIIILLLIHASLSVDMLKECIYIYIYIYPK